MAMTTVEKLRWSQLEELRAELVTTNRRIHRLEKDRDGKFASLSAEVDSHVQEATKFLLTEVRRSMSTICAMITKTKVFALLVCLSCWQHLSAR